MDERRYLELADVAFKRVIDAFETVDVDEADAEAAGDVVTITFRGGARCVVNTQRPTRQIWVAGGKRAWHFSYDAERGTWLDDKGSGEELFTTLAGIAAASGVKIAF